MEIKSNSGAVIYKSDKVKTIKDLVQEALKAGADLSEANLAAADLQAIKIGENGVAIFKGANLSRAMLSASTLSGADFSRANLSHATFFGAKLHRACFAGANLMGASLIKADLSSADFTGANLMGADMTNARLDGANMEGAAK
jgi:uncharacterized protein YjbI with pentapeptide repeats